MLDINAIIPPMLADIITLQPQFPDILPNFPLAVLTPMDNGARAIFRGVERLTTAAFQIDVYDTDLKRCEETAAEIAARLVQRGFSRGSGAEIRENGLRRKTMSFSAIIDTKTGMIYRR